MISDPAHGGIQPVKAPLFLLLASASLAKAALIAHVATDRGVIDVELQHAQAPQTVANFITLSQGTRSRVDPKSGNVTTAPLFVGEKFFRVVNDTGFKVIQTGSGSGTNIGGPGYTFRDEFDPTLTHVPYVLSMANGGINTNGSQIYFTGNAATPSLDNNYTVFGLVTATASRAVIDAIIAAGANATTITGITFERTDPAAVAFNELAQGLPVVSELEGTISVLPQTSVTFTPKSPLAPGTQLKSFRSSNLSTWSDSSSSFVGNQSPPLVSSVIDSGTLPKAFYRLSSIRYPDDTTLSHFGSATFVVTLAGTTITYDLNPAGNGGTVTATNPSPQPPDTGPFVVLARTVSPYEVVLTIDNGTAVSPQFLRYAAHSDDFAPGQSSGRLVVEFFNGLFWQFGTTGTHTLTE